MSTTFGIRKIDEWGEEIEIPIARRLISGCRWSNELA